MILYNSQASTQAWPIAWKNTFSCSQWWRHSQPRAWYKHSCPFLLGCLFVHTKSALQGCLETSSPLHKCTWVLSAKKKKRNERTSLVAQWLRIRLPTQGTRVRALVREDPTCRRAIKPVCHNYWACALEPTSHNYWARVPQLLKPACLEPVLCN